MVCKSKGRESIAIGSKRDISNRGRAKSTRAKRQSKPSCQPNTLITIKNRIKNPNQFRLKNSKGLTKTHHSSKS